MYDHYIALDWAQSNMAIARMTKQTDFLKVFEYKADLGELKIYLDSIRGTKVLAFEETTTAHWLYVELLEHVDKIIVCDPYRNKLLSEGAKTDKIDASKLVKLLKGGYMKPVFHSTDRIIELRKLVSSYNDLVARGVRLKNQKSAILRGQGLPKNAELPKTDGHQTFVMQRIENAIQQYEDDKKLYESEFEKLLKAETTLKHLKQLPGIGPIGAVKIFATVVDARRFAHRNDFLAYSGLARLERMSGGRSYGSKRPRFRQELKSVFKTAALAAIGGDNCFREVYESLIKNLRYPDHKARHAVARSIATSVWGVMKTGKRFSEEKVREKFLKK